MCQKAVIFGAKNFYYQDVVNFSRLWIKIHVGKVGVEKVIDAGAAKQTIYCLKENKYSGMISESKTNAPDPVSWNYQSNVLSYH